MGDALRSSGGHPVMPRNEKKIDAEKPRQETFREGMLVEVKSDEDGYHRSWYGVTIIRLFGMDNFLVEYDSLKTNDENQPLREEVSPTDVRSLPPCNLHHGHYKRLDEVDVWCAGGWWIGEIYKVLNRKKYIVQFAFTDDKREVDHSSLRSHQDWIHGKWITSKVVHKGDISTSYSPAACSRIPGCLDCATHCSPAVFDMLLYDHFRLRYWKNCQRESLCSY
ncbi:protein AGENET DOMAIN (AGD)-CONTAINING P1-like isoform X1 [Spinacia oleracea]|uniref:DUF724 domain-containing protein 3-like isoform X1 n=1 Tax=Spinacia oleracea TaxID=3562 RepID=A0A9R0K2T2_SPIOL|nr:protein AGENET DOMAIN (AGD)-CONTAINING P1-like isoform X1 [Spinacia oleracea]XP_021856376.1 protein AGENET DOMAIN (AGD)-CONTAINING P1-like isoform X1 [Spinacia oleracea]